MIEKTSLFVNDNSAEEFRVFDIGDENGGDTTSIIYPDMPCFLADRRRFVMNTAKGLMICDPDEKGALQPVFKNNNKCELSSFYVTPDGRYGYFSPKSTDNDLLNISISRVDFATFKVEKIFHREKGLLPGTNIPIGKFDFATVSADNQRVAGVCRIDEGNTENALFGIFSLDCAKENFNLVWSGPYFNNPHLRYSLSPDPAFSHDLLIQMNHGARFDKEGKSVLSLGPPSDLGIDLHIIRDDGSNRRDLPFGRDGLESCIGHQVWRGRNSDSVATIMLQNNDQSYGWADHTTQEILAGYPIPVEMNAPHQGRLTPGDSRIDLSENFAQPRFCHLSVDDSGLNYALDTFPLFDGKRSGMQIYTGHAETESDGLSFRYILNTGVLLNKSNKNSHYHAHPVISPDAGFLLFNSNITGAERAYMVVL